MIKTAGPVVAGAGIELGEGFRSARVEGGAGDRRDAVLAALRIPGQAEQWGLGAAYGLFGPRATKPLGAAARTAVEEGRWPALRYAVAAGDLLEPEQLVRLLALPAPDGVDPFPDGLPSVVGTHLARVLQPLSRSRRFDVLTDLWHQVCAYRTRRLRGERLRASQGREDRSEDIIRRHERYIEDDLLARLRAGHGKNEPTLAQAALWQPSNSFWLAQLDWVMRDAMAATVLARTAVTMVDDGLEAALGRHRTEIDAAAEISDAEAAAAGRTIPGFTGLPARPGVVLRRIIGRLQRGEPVDPFVRQHLANARDYGFATISAMWTLFDRIAAAHAAGLADLTAWWATRTLGDWRERVGYFSPGGLAGWQPDRTLPWPGTPTLAERLRAHPDQPAPEIETAGDLFWYAELADALAQLQGHDAAAPMPDLIMDYPEEPQEQPLVPRPHSIAVAAAGTAQLVDLGGRVPVRGRTWPELVAGLLADAAVAEALTDSFAVAPAVLAFDATIVPGTDARVEIARNGRQLADWADYMSNCIAGVHYVTAAEHGRTVLVALRAPDGRMLANAELTAVRRGWRLREIQARFNTDSDPDLLRHMTAWVAALPADEPAPPAAEIDRDRPPRAVRPTPAQRLVRDLGDQLAGFAAGEVHPSTLQMFAVLAKPLGRTHDAPTALRRADIAELAELWRLSLADPSAPSLIEIWQLTADRPLSRAVGRCRPADRDRLQPLLADEPLPGSLRPLARLPKIAPARTVELVALRLRIALGLLIRADDPDLARTIDAQPYAPLIRSAALAVTSWGGLDSGHAVTAVSPPRRVRLPGFPASSLNDDVWQSAWPDAVELGGHPDGFWDRLAQDGLLLPTSWLPQGWPSLYTRAIRTLRWPIG